MTSARLARHKHKQYLNILRVLTQDVLARDTPSDLLINVFSYALSEIGKSI